jgi:hypothetical protein
MKGNCSGARNRRAERTVTTAGETLSTTSAYEEEWLDGADAGGAGGTVEGDTGAGDEDLLAWEL